MPAPEIEEFAELLVEHVRDAAIRSGDMTFRSKGPTGARWREAACHGSPEKYAKELIPDIVDDVMFYLLHAIDDGLLKLLYTASNGKIVDLSTEGLSEMAGWYMGSNGWRAAYAKERFVDDFSDLAGE